MNRYTQLLPFTNGHGESAGQEASVEWQLHHAVSTDVIVLSWAALLRAFTNDESPVFVLNGNPVKADLSTGTFEPVSVDADYGSGACTAVFIEDGSKATEHGVGKLHPSGIYSLSLTLNLSTGIGTLHSPRGIDGDFLLQIGKQLEPVVQQRAVSSGAEVSFSSTEGPKISISNPSPCTLPGPETLHELALGTFVGSKPAIEFLRADETVQRVSYSELDCLSTKLACQISSALAPRQNDPNVMIPVLIPQSVDLYVSYLAILKAGAAFCPLNVDAPVERVQFILQDVEASVVIVQTELAKKLPNDERITVITTDGIDAEVPAPPSWRKCGSSNLAYVMYTSGSTGRPKGVGVSHLAATQALLAHADLIPHFNRFLQFASPTFDVSVFEYFFPLMRNATVIASDRELLLRDISRVIRTMEVDAAELTPTVAGELLRTRAAAPSLRVLLTIGEMLTRHVVDQFGEADTSDGILYGMYGPTEAAIHCTAAPKVRAKDRVNLIGPPFKTVSAYVVSLLPDDNLPGQEPRILPLGQIGELVVGGPQLADGYLNRPEENAKAFIDSVHCGRLYRTGDKARMLPSGELECFGRVSTGQVKLRGQRIELGEIEHAVCMAANVRSAVSIVINGNLVAFLQQNDNVTSDDELRQACRRWLPRFMVPGEFVLVDKFPQLPSGKIDRKTLEADYINAKMTERPGQEITFRDETEETIFSCVKRILGVSVSATESLASAGLDSLTAIRLASSLRETGINLGVEKILEADSVDGIWHLNRTLQIPGSAQRDRADLERVWKSVVDAGFARLRSLGLDNDTDCVEPCCHIQQAMIAETVRDSRAYCNFVELEFPGTKFADVKAAFCKVAQQNDILRSGFIEIGAQDSPYSRFVWKELKDHIFLERESFEYKLSLGDQHGILYPLRIQYRKKSTGLSVLVHMHHAIYDGWSWDLILSDLDSTLTGKALTQRPSYRNVTNFFIESALPDTASESTLYWQDLLYRMTPAIWPNLNTRTDVPCGRGEVSHVLNVPMPQLNEVSQRLRVSRQAIFQAVFGYLLSCYLGTGDVVFGSVVSGRTSPVHGIESIIGPCIRTLPTRLNMGKVHSISDLILATQNLNRKSLQHGNIPLHDIKKASGIDPSLSLFDSAVVWQETIWAGQQRDTLVREVASTDFLEFAFLLELEPKDGRVHAKATYQESIFPPAQVSLLLQQIDQIASVFVDGPDLPTNDICHRLPSSLLSISNAEYEGQTDLPSLASTVENVAETDPDRLAVEFLHSQDPNGTMKVEGVTYHQLNSQANRLAHLLLDVGVQQGDLVAILLGKSVELYISILAVFKVGAGYIPLTPQSPSQRMHSILSESRPRVCVSSALLRQEHGMAAVGPLRIVELAAGTTQGYPDSNLPIIAKGTDVAYAVFTSGSTGIPKGVLVPHSNVQSNITVLSEIYPSPLGSKMLQACSHGFDVSVFEILFTWRTGMTLCATTNDILFRDIQHVIRGLGITHLSLTPTVAALVHPDEVPTVRCLVCAGEALTEKVHNVWAGRGLYQGYGPSEMTNVCTVCPSIEAWQSPRNVGPPLKNTSVFLASEDDQFCMAPRGAVGELCFAGDQVARGYLNMPEMTAEKFIVHPQYGRLYRTGDFARLLSDGSIHFIGRRDNQIKLRGQRIELGEINSVILGAESVRDCASVILEKDSHKQQNLVAFWVPAAKTEGQVSAVANDLFEKTRATLPGYMIPSLLIPIDALPMTENGKIDHGSLRHRFQSMSADDLAKFSSDFETADEGDLSETERTIAAILSEVTGAGVQDIRRNTSFYHAGLDSISAISFSRKLRDAGFGQLDVSAILRHSSIARLSSVMSITGERKQDISMDGGLEGLFGDDFVQQTKADFANAGRSVQKIYPCTPLQEAMLSVDVSGSNSAYFNHLLFELRVDAEAFRGVWDQMLERHAILRTCFKATNNTQFAYAQVVLEDAVLPLRHVDATADQLDFAVEKQKRQFQEQFQASGALPYSLTVFRDRNARKAFLLFSIHHALHDGEAMTLLLQEVQSLFSGQRLQDAVPFERFIRHMASADSNASDEYWDRHLSGVSPHLLAGSKSESPPFDTPLQSHIDLEMPFDAFKGRCKEVSVTPLNVFHAAWTRLLSFYVGSSDICFGNVFSCRTIPLEGADRIVGPCFNTLPIHMRFSPTATNEDVMKLARKTNSDTLPHQLSSLRRIQRRALGDGSQLFDTLVILQTRDVDLDTKLWELVSEEGNMDFPFICEIVPNEKRDNVHICLHSRQFYISADDAELMVRQFAALIEHTLRYPSGQASDRRVLGDAVPFFPKKVSRRAKRFESLISSQHQTAPPWSRKEEEVRDILCRFAKMDAGKVSLETTIFQLGLDSINAVQIAGSLRELGYDVSAGGILEAATIANISNLLDSGDEVVKEEDFDFAAFQSQHMHSICRQLHVSDGEVECVRPCTPVQNGMLAMFSNSGGDMYFNRMTLKSSIPLDASMLRQAWSKSMGKHEMLRTGFVQLRDQKHPFAMITYRAGAAELPWYEARNTASQKEENSVLSHLHLPPWYLVVEHSDSGTAMHLSALHAIYDAQSLHLIIADVAAAYKGESLSDAPSINSTLGPILVESLMSDESESFWTELSKDAQPTKFPDLNPFRMQPEERELLVRSMSCSKSRNALEDGCQSIGTTLQAAGQAAWARLLAAYTGEPNVVFGVVSSGRNLSVSAQEAAFPCLVTLPSPCRVTGTNHDLLHGILNRNASMMKYQFTPLPKIQRWLKSDEGLSDTLFVYQKFSAQKDDVSLWEVVGEDTRIDYPVSIEMIPHDTKLELQLTHRSDVVPTEQAGIILEQLHHLLEDCIFSPNSSASDYSSLGSNLLAVTPAREDKISCSASLLHQFVEQNAAITPSKMAFEFASTITEQSIQKRTWTYSELNDDGNRITRVLQSKGAVPGSLIAVCFDKCPEASLGILGILKAGCAYVAIDPNAPIARKQFILDDSASKLLLCTQSAKTELGGLSGVEVIALDQSGLLDAVSSAQPTLSRPICPQDTCYCLYTSGTTGTPKGCEITHENAVQAMLAFQRLFDGHWDGDSRWLQFASFHFDVSVLEQYWSWSVGICVTSCPRDLLFEDLPGTIRRLQITHIDLTPSLARLVHPDEVPSLCRGVFITGGEQLQQEILDAWGKHGVIYNGYGPTEVTIGCTMLPRVPANGKPSNIGPQFDNVGSYVLVPGTFTPVPRGAVGELCVSGALVGRGYLNRPELTKNRFQTLSENERIYRTGDLVRILHDGNFLFLGRIDDQVKLRGQRLEIGEINEVIKRATSELGNVATLVAKHPKQSKEQLVSFVTRDADTQGKSSSAGVRFSADDQGFVSTIKDACHSSLPGYMVPTHIIPMTMLPLSANNKVDTKVLKGIYQDLSLEEIQRLASMIVEQVKDSPEQRKIMSLLSEFLGIAGSEILLWSSIFELGLDSISVISFCRRLKDAGFSQAQASLIMKNPTISGMANALQGSKTSSASQAALHRDAKQRIEAFAHKNLHSILENLRITENDVNEIAPCTPLQEGMIYHFQNSDRPLYCSSFSFELHGGIGLAKLKMAWSQAQEDTQILRTRLSPTPDGYAQAVLNNCQLRLYEVSVPSEEIEKTRESRFSKWTASLGDLTKNLWEVLLINSSRGAVMCLNIFHALFDGNSLPLLLEKVARNYLELSQAADEPSFFDVLPAGPLCTDRSAEQFWKDHLKEALHGSVPRSNLPEHTSATLKATIDATEQVDKFKKSFNITEQAVLHACWLLTLQNQFEIVPQLGIVVSGRALDVAGIENVIGPLFNTIPSNINFAGLNLWSDLVQRCHDYHASTIPVQHTPLRDIMKWTHRQPSEPLFDSLFVFQRSNEDESLGSRLFKEPDSEADHEYPLAFEICRNGNASFTATIAIQDRVMSTDSAREMLAVYERNLHALLQNPANALPRVEGLKANGVVHMGTGNGDDHASADMLLDRQNGNFQWTHGASSIRDIIAELADADHQSVGADMSFFEFGLDSIDAVKLSSRLKKLGIHLAVSVIMRHPTPRAMTEHLSLLNGDSQDAGPSLLGRLEKDLTTFFKQESKLPEDDARVLPATPIQEAMVAEMIASGYAHYYNHDVLELNPHVDLVRLSAAWKAVVDANPILRTSFVEVWDPKIPVSFAQVVHREGGFHLQTVDLGGIDTFIKDLQSRAASDTSHRPLMTVSIAKENGKHYLILSMAHALYDGWSIDLLHGDVATYYAGGQVRRPSYDGVLEQIIASSGERASKFWRAALANFVPAPFPKGKDAGKDESTVRREEKVLTALPCNANEFCKQNGITMQALCVTAWALVLAGYVGKLDVAFGLVLSGRNIADSENVMFPTMNTVAMRAILHGRRLEMVKYVQGTLVDMAEHQHFPLRKARPDTGSRQRFDSLFIYQKRRSAATSDVATLYKSSGGSSAIDFPVCAEMESMDETVMCRVACRDNVMGAGDTVKLLGRTEEVLASILQEPDQRTTQFAEGTMNISGCPVSVDDHPNGTVHDGTDLQLRRPTEWSSLELQIRNVLSVVSGIPEEEIGKDATLFQLGLDSISAIKVSSLLKKQSLRLAVSDMLKVGNIEGMALAANDKLAQTTPEDIRTALNGSLDGVDSASLLQSHGIEPDQIEDLLPVTAGQSYFLAMNALNHDVFYPGFYYLVSKQLSATVLDDAWDRLTREMPMLRTAFLPTNLRHPSFVQAVVKALPNPVIWHRESMPWECSRRNIQTVPAALHASQTPKGTSLMLQIHHALYDAVSLPKIMDTLAILCNGCETSSQENAQLAPYIAFQRMYSPVDARRQFWQSYLGHGHDEKAAVSQSDFAGPIEQCYRPGCVSNMSKVEGIAKSENLSFQALFLAVYARVHARYSAQTAVGLYLANRSYAMEALPDLNAPTVNIVPLRIEDMHGEGSLFAYARKIQDELNEIGRVEYSGVSLAEIWEWTGVRIDTCINFMRFSEIEGNNDHVDGSQGTRIAPVSAQELQSLTDQNENGTSKTKINGTADSLQPNGSAVPNGAHNKAGSVTTGSLNHFKEIFKPTLDIEAAVRNDGLDLGVFGPRHRLHGRAERVVQDVQLEMSKLFEDGDAVQMYDRSGYILL